MLKENILVETFIKERYQDEEIRKSFKKAISWEDAFDKLD